MVGEREVNVKCHLDNITVFLLKIEIRCRREDNQ